MRKAKNRKQDRKEKAISMKKQKQEIKDNRIARDNKYQEWQDKPESEWTEERKKYKSA